MKKMKITFFGVAIYMILLTASSKGLTARIKPNRTTFFFESGSKPTENITCESDCGRYQWRCTYSWVIKKNGGLYNYIAKNNSLIDTPQKENVTLRCHVTYSNNNDYDYSEAIKIFIKERMPPSITTTPIPDGNNAGNAETSVTKESGYAPCNITIESTEDINDLQEGPGDIEIICNADCKPKCDRYRIYHIGTKPTTFERARISVTKHRRNSGRYYCAAFNSLSNGFLNSTNSLDIDIKYTAVILESNVKEMTIDISEMLPRSVLCTTDCNFHCTSEIEVKRNSQPYRKIQSGDSIFENRAANLSDDGDYVCMVGNTLSESFKLIIHHPPGSVTISPDSDIVYTKRYGKPLHDISCKADCLPECTYKWYREGYSYFYTTVNSLFATRSYFYGSSYRFRCLASNNIGRDRQSKWITVEVKDGPENVTIIPSSSEKENDSFQLTCSASCYHDCQSYSWYYKDAWKDQKTPILAFKSLSREDSGNYLCRVNDDFGHNDSEYYTMNVRYGPKNVEIAYSSLYGHFIEGKDRISFTCKADCNPGCGYLFYRNGTSTNKTYTRELVHRNMSGRYTCSARNDIMITDMHSSNFIDIRIKYKPTITSFVNQTTITAPALSNLAFSVDSFPSSNVTIFHETNPVAFIPNVTGHLSFNVSVESCLDQGEYRIEAENDAGVDRLTVRADVECSPIIVRHTNLSQIESQVRDSFNYTVEFMANPDAEVSWTFIKWNKNEPKKLEKPQIQNLKGSTIVEINRLNFSFFGIYKLELKNDFGTITQEFHIRGPPQRPTYLSVYCPGSAIISWRPGSDGGSNQIFTIEYSNNSSHWQILRAQSVVPIDNNFMSAQINDILPNTMYSFRIRAENEFGNVESDTAVNCTRQSNDEMASFFDNRNALFGVGIGVVLFLLLIATVALIAALKLKRKRKAKNQDNSLRNQVNNSNEDNGSEIVENILYITADDAREQIQAPADTTQNPQNGNDVYAEVEKKPKTSDIDDQPVYTDVCKPDQKKKKPAIAAKPSKVKKDERPSVNKDGLIYVELDLQDAPSTSKGAFVIHGADDRTHYADISFTRRADPPPDTDKEECKIGEEKEKA